MKKYDPLDYIRTYYRVPAFVGAKVSYRGKSGVVKGASGPHVAILIEGDKFAKPYHPRDEDLKWAEEAPVNS